MFPVNKQLSPTRTSSLASVTCPALARLGLSALVITLALTLLPTLAAATLSISAPSSAGFSTHLSTLGDTTGNWSVAIHTSSTTTAGWSMTVTSTHLQSGIHAFPDDVSIISSQPTVSNLSTGAVAPTPTGSVNYPFGLPAGIQAPSSTTFYGAAPGTGTGTFDVTVPLATTVPSNAFAGNYNALVTFAITSGP